jgi:hypothetical protein
MLSCQSCACQKEYRTLKWSAFIKYLPTAYYNCPVICLTIFTLYWKLKLCCNLTRVCLTYFILYEFQLFNKVYSSSTQPTQNICSPINLCFKTRLSSSVVRVWKLLYGRQIGLFYGANIYIYRSIVESHFIFASCWNYCMVVNASHGRPEILVHIWLLPLWLAFRNIDHRCVS